jgi:hypothetical protein
MGVEDRISLITAVFRPLSPLVSAVAVLVLPSSGQCWLGLRGTAGNLVEDGTNGMLPPLEQNWAPQM